MRFKLVILLLMIISITCSSFEDSFAKSRHKKYIKNTPEPIRTSLVVDYSNGKILHNVNGNSKIYPASLTKLMTLYLAFDSVIKGRLKLNQELTTSKKASEMKPCKLGLNEGDKIKVKDAILALIVKSCNDVAVVLAEAIAGSEEKFAKLMNKKAKILGMKSSNFVNASGWHHPSQVTTAKDLAKLTIAIKRDFPEFYPLFAKTSFKYNDEIISGHNRITKNYPGAEGMKTGYTSHAGFNLITTASRDGKSLIAISTGNPSGAIRDAKITSLLDSYFGVQPKVLYANNNEKNHYSAFDCANENSKKINSNVKLAKISKKKHVISKKKSNQKNKSKKLITASAKKSKNKNISKKVVYKTKIIKKKRSKV